MPKAATADRLSASGTLSFSSTLSESLDQRDDLGELIGRQRDH